MTTGRSRISLENVMQLICGYFSWLNLLCDARRMELTK